MLESAYPKLSWPYQTLCGIAKRNLQFYQKLQESMHKSHTSEDHYRKGQTLYDFGAIQKPVRDSPSTITPNFQSNRLHPATVKYSESSVKRLILAMKRTPTENQVVKMKFKPLK